MFVFAVLLLAFITGQG